jgi:hypothetical protein
LFGDSFDLSPPTHFIQSPLQGGPPPLDGGARTNVRAVRLLMGDPGGADTVDETGVAVVGAAASSPGDDATAGNGPEHKVTAGGEGQENGMGSKTVEGKVYSPSVRSTSGRGLRGRGAIVRGTKRKGAVGKGKVAATKAKVEGVTVNDVGGSGSPGRATGQARQRVNPRVKRTRTV